MCFFCHFSNKRDLDLELMFCLDKAKKFARPTLGKGYKPSQEVDSLNDDGSGGSKRLNVASALLSSTRPH
jgi:hypothetical protein